MTGYPSVISADTPIILPNWVVNPNVKSFFTTRKGDPKAASTVGEYIRDASQSRDKTHIEPVWLEQIHSTVVLRLNTRIKGLRGDGIITKIKEFPCAIRVADCVPILLCDEGGTEVSAIHAGWRGLLSGIVQKAVESFSCKESGIIAWVGPSISKFAYNVGADFFELFTAKDTDYRQYFEKKENLLYFDIREAVKSTLHGSGITKLFETARCVHTESDSFYSARRQKTNERMAAVIWISCSGRQA